MIYHSDQSGLSGIHIPSGIDPCLRYLAGTEIEEPPKKSRTARSTPLPKSPKAEPRRASKGSRKLSMAPEPERSAKRHKGEGHRSESQRHRVRH